MSKQLVRTWLENYMFNGNPDARRQADKISGWLADHKHFKTHSRHIERAELKRMNLVVVDLEDDPMLEDLCMSVFYATMHTFAGTGAAKIVENHLHRAYIQFLPPPVASPAARGP